MDHTQKRIFAILLLLSAALFVLFWIPNQAASEDMGMVLAFEPDEGVPFPYVLDMIHPGESLKQTIVNFISYDYYFYGFPYFAYSALLLAPLQAAGQIDNTPLVMVVLRNFVSVLPMLAAILLLVYMQTGFRDYRAVALFVFLAAVPGVVQNNFWWHPDGLAILLAVLTLFFLARDELRFRRDFYLAAAACGLCAQAKLIGFYFFLAVLVSLWLGWRRGQPPRRVLSAALGFIVVMTLAFFASSPILLYAGARAQYLRTLIAESRLITLGYEVFNPPSLLQVTRILDEHFGGWLLFSAYVVAAAWAAARGPRRLLHTYILAWALPLAAYVFGATFLKFQYWMPAALPLLSSLVIALPASRAEAADWWRGQRGWALGAGLLLAVAVFSFAGFVQNSVGRYQAQLTRQENSASIAFYHRAAEALAPLPPSAYHVYADVTVYIPAGSEWVRTSRFETLDHEFIGSHGFQILLLMQQNILDYLNEDAIGLDPEQFAINQDFYRDADAGNIPGFRLVFRNSYGLVFVSEELYERYFAE